MAAGLHYYMITLLHELLYFIIILTLQIWMNEWMNDISSKKVFRNQNYSRLWNSWMCKKLNFFIARIIYPSWCKILLRKWKLHQIGKYRDTEWLEAICNSDGYNSWVNYTSDRSQKIMSLLELNTVFQSSKSRSMH